MIRPILPLLILIAGQPAPARGQSNPWSDSLLPRLRAAATMVPGARPRVVRVFRFGAMNLAESYLLENGSGQLIPATYTVFQIVFPDGYLMVDAGMDPEVAGDTTARYQDQNRRVQAALRNARAIVVTHEHHDHVGGVVRSPDLRLIGPKTILNRAQVRTLRERPNVPLIRLDSAAATRYTVIDYDLLYPLAPGVVLVRAGGHTPGSQLVYIRLVSGRELLLIGDVAWSMAGVEQHRQKPDSISQNMREDRKALQAQLDWLNGLTSRAGIQVVNGHDDRWLKRLIANRVLQEGLDLGPQVPKLSVSPRQ